MSQPRMFSKFITSIIIFFLALLLLLTGTVLLFLLEETQFFSREVLKAKAENLINQVWPVEVGIDSGYQIRGWEERFRAYITNYPLEKGYIAGVALPKAHRFTIAAGSREAITYTMTKKEELISCLPALYKKPRWSKGEPQNSLLRFSSIKPNLMVTHIEPVYRKERFIANIIIAYPLKKFFDGTFRSKLNGLISLFLSIFLLSFVIIGCWLFKMRKNIEQLYLSLENTSAALLEEPAPYIYEEFWQVAQWNRAVAGQLQESVQLQATLFQNSPCGIMILNADGEVVETNSAAWEFLNRLDHSGPQWKVTDIAPEFATALEQVVKGKIHTGEATFSNEQEEIAVIFSAAPIQTESWQGAVMFWLDQTEVKQLGLQLRQTERYQLVGELASMAAHELRNPLTTIVANAQLGQIVAEQGKAKELFLRIQQASHRMSDFLSEMMNLCRPFEAELAPIEVKSVLGDILSLVKAQLLTQGIGLDCKIDENLPRIRAEGKLLRQAFLNLTQNAIQAMPTGGRLIVKAHTADNEVVVSFGDTGMGMSPEIQGQIFKRFVTSKENGNGLGLFITRQIVVQTLGGRIWFSSHSGEGTEFFLAFPIIDSAIQAKEETSEVYWRPTQSMVQYS